MLNESLKKVDDYKPEVNYYTGSWSLLKQASSQITTWDTGVDLNLLRFVGSKSVSYPQNFVRIQLK